MLIEVLRQTSVVETVYPNGSPNEDQTGVRTFDSHIVIGWHNADGPPSSVPSTIVNIEAGDIVTLTYDSEGAVNGVSSWHRNPDYYDRVVAEKQGIPVDLLDLSRHTRNVVRGTHDFLTLFHTIVDPAHRASVNTHVKAMQDRAASITRSDLEAQMSEIVRLRLIAGLVRESTTDHVRQADVAPLKAFAAAFTTAFVATAWPVGTYITLEEADEVEAHLKTLAINRTHGIHADPEGIGENLAADWRSWYDLARVEMQPRTKLVATDAHGVEETWIGGRIYEKTRRQLPVTIGADYHELAPGSGFRGTDTYMRLTAKCPGSVWVGGVKIADLEANVERVIQERQVNNLALEIRLHALAPTLRLPRE